METANETIESPRKVETFEAMDDNAGNTPATPGRRVLGEVSPNVKIASSSPSILKRSMAGSPLKRSFTAAMEGGGGFQYLKRRKLDENETLSAVVGRSLDDSRDNIHVVEAEQIELQAEQSTPTEPNTPSEENNESSGSSAERKSFSSLINYDLSSQTSNILFKAISDAEMLRLRLRVAMYKVRTKQTEVPFTDLIVEDQSPQAKAQRAADEAVEELRREAREVAARQPRPPVPKLLPAPVLLPTAYSSRMIYETQLPCSPLPLTTPGEFPTVADVKTPLREVRKVESPATSVHRLQKPFEQELTSSAVKGRAAEELLGLRHAM